MSRLVWSALATAAITLSAWIASPTSALAHERRDVGKVQFVVGFMVEPAYAGEKNGVSLRVQVPGTPATPITGLEKTLQLEVTHVPSGKSMSAPLRGVFGDAGHYTADLLPTVPGVYRFKFTGTIEGATVNETFTSGSGFNSVEPTDAIQFPEAIAPAASIQGAARDAQAAAEDAAGTAQTALTLAIVAVAVAVGGTGLALLRTRRA